MVVGKRGSTFRDRRQVVGKGEPSTLPDIPPSPSPVNPVLSCVHCPSPPSLLLAPLVHPLTLTAWLQGGVLTGNHKWKIAYKQPKPKSATKAE